MAQDGNRQRYRGTKNGWVHEGPSPKSGGCAPVILAAPAYFIWAIVSLFFRRNRNA